MTKRKSDKGKPPSKKKYEEKNPTVSGRMPKEKRDKFYANLAKSGRTVSDALNSLADDLELKVIPINEARQAGYEEAKNLYMVTYPCSVCGEQMAITSKKAKEAVMEFMIEQGWGHAKCHERKRHL